MHLPNRAATSVLCMAAVARLCSAQEWTETSVIQKFLEQTPYAREARARTAIARAETQGRTLYANPRLNYTREPSTFHRQCDIGGIRPARSDTCGSGRPDETPERPATVVASSPLRISGICPTCEWKPCEELLGREVASC